MLDEAMPAVLRLLPLQYAHITNESTTVITLLVGPRNYTLSSNETVSLTPTSFHVVPPHMYCCVKNPHVFTTAADGTQTPVLDDYGQVQCRMAEVEYRYHVAPFPLYPDEELLELALLEVLSAKEALLLRATRELVSADGVVRYAGEHYIIRGPSTYYPRADEHIVERRPVLCVEAGCGAWCRATESFPDDDGSLVIKGESFLRTTPGSFVARPHEDVMGWVRPITLDHHTALHVYVSRCYTDPRQGFEGIVRRANDVFMVTGDDCHAFLVHPYDTVQKTVERIVVPRRSYCIVRQQDNSRVVYTDTTLFLKPGDEMEVAPRAEYLLLEDQALLLVALEDFEDTAVSPPVTRKCRSRWLLHGPRSFIPSSHVRILPDHKTGLEYRQRVVLCEGQGLYVRNVTTGVVRLILGPTSYLLEAYEEVWEKPLPAHVERHLDVRLRSHNTYMHGGMAESEFIDHRDRAVVYHVPHRSVTQLYNYSTQTTRTIFGPERVVLEPDEGFTVVSLSGSPWDPANPTRCLPKEPDRITALYLFLGPSNMSDVVHVETRDHVQLALQLCYDWYFDLSYGDAEAANRCFIVNDFVGNACSYMASRIRSAVASLPFEHFHKNSTQSLKTAVFGVDPATGHSAHELRFSTNGLVVTSVETQELEVLDARARRGLQKSVKMAIEIMSKQQAAHARQVATALEQKASGLLSLQRMKDQVDHEQQRRILLEMEGEALSIIDSGKSAAAAEAVAKATIVGSMAAVEVASLRATRESLASQTMAEVQRRKNEMLLQHKANMAALSDDVERAREEINGSLMDAFTSAIGQETLVAVAKAGPEVQAQLLGSLGLEGYLVTDGSTPINLFRTAERLVAERGPQQLTTSETATNMPAAA